MRFNQRISGITLTLFLLLFPFTLFAQSDDIVVVGSSIVAPEFERLAESAELTFDVNLSGTTAGISAFCNGDADVVNTTRAMTVDEETLCAENGIEFAELMLGYEGIALIANSEAEFLSCVSSLELDSIFAPSAQATLWSEVISSVEDEVEISVAMPAPGTLSYALLDDMTGGVGFNTMVDMFPDDAEIINYVSSDAGAFGVVSLQNLQPESEVMVVDVRSNATNRCITPSVEAIRNDLYAGGLPMLSYVRSDVLSANESLQAVYEAASETDDKLALPITELDLASNADAISGELGRQFSRDLTDFEIPAGVAGEINLSGAAGAARLLDTTIGNMTTQYNTVTITSTFDGEPAGLRKLCNSEVDMTVIYGDMADKDMSNCEAVDVEVMALELGTQATVLVANEQSDYLSCLTTDELTTLWRIESAEEVTAWSQVNEDYPDETFILFAGDPNNSIPSLMMLRSSGQNLPMRSDVEIDSDPLYRAAAVANVENSLTYMSWQQYQDVLVNEQSGIQLVAVDAGEGCVSPTEDSIISGEYSLSRSMSLLVNTQAVERIDVKAFLWFLFADDNLANFERANFDSMTLLSLADIREQLEAAYDEADERVTARIASEAESAEESPAVDGEDTEDSDE